MYVCMYSNDTNEVGNNSFSSNSEQLASTTNVYLTASLPKLPKLQLPMQVQWESNQVESLLGLVQIWNSWQPKYLKREQIQLFTINARWECTTRQ